MSPVIRSATAAHQGSSPESKLGDRAEVDLAEGQPKKDGRHQAFDG